MKIRKNGKVINLTESDLQKIVKKVLSEGPQADRNIDLEEVLNSITVVDGNGDNILERTTISPTFPELVINPSRFGNEEVIKITIPGLKCEEVSIGLDNSEIKTKCSGDTIKIVAGDLLDKSYMKYTIAIVGNVSPDKNIILLHMVGSSIKPKGVNEYRRKYGRRR